MNRISALVKQTPERPASCYHARTQQEDDPLGTRKQTLTRYWICQGPDFGLAASRAVISKFFLLNKPASAWYVCYSSQNRLRQCPIKTLE